LRQTEQFVGHRDCVDVGVFAVVKVGVWPPNALKHFEIEAQTLDRPSEAQPRVAPVLPEVAVHGVFLSKSSFHFIAFYSLCVPLKFGIRLRAEGEENEFIWLFSREERW
jgi:hypothetical protein